MCEPLLALTSCILSDRPLGQLLNLGKESIVFEEGEHWLTMGRLAYDLAQLTKYNLVYNRTHLSEDWTIARGDGCRDLDGMVIIVFNHLVIEKRGVRREECR